MKTQTLEKIMKLLVYSTFFIPLVLLSQTFIFPFIVPKILLFRSIAMILFGGYVMLLLSQWRRYKIQMTWITWIIALFFASFAISTFVGVDWYKSLWDGHERMLGLFTILHYILYYIVVSNIFVELRDWKKLFRIFLIAGSIVMFIAILQRFVNPELLLNKGADRVSATLGNPIYLSGYGLFLFSIGLLLGLWEKRGSWMQWASFAGAVLGIIGIFAGGTRGTLLGFFAAIGVMGLIYTMTLKGHKKIKQLIIIAIGVGILLLGVAYIYRQTDLVKSIPAVGRLVNVSLDQDTGTTRLMAWGIAVEAWQERPVFGWGPNNYYFAFNKYYRPAFLEHGWGETWFDNAHSAIFNTLATQGIIGIMLYVGLFVVPGVVLIRAYRDDTISIHVFAVSSAFLLGHFVHNAFVFENPTSYLYFFVFLAFINTITKRQDTTENEGKKHILIGSMLGVGVVVLLLVYSTNINPARANMTMLQTIRAYHAGDPSAQMQYDLSTAIPSPHIDDMRNDHAQTMEQIVDKYIRAKRIDDMRKYTAHAYEEVGKNLNIHPQDVRVHIMQAHLAQLMAGLSQDQSWLLKQEHHLEEALQYSPKRQQVIFELVTVKSMLGEHQEGLALMEQAIQDHDDVPDTWYRLIYAYIDVDDQEKARTAYQLSQDRGMVFRDDVYNKINQALYE